MIFTALCFLIFTILSTSHHLEKKFPSNLIEDMLYLPSGKFLKGAALSYDEMLADLFWIKTIGYYGGHSKNDHDYKWLNNIITATTTLDPFFQYPYEFGGVILSTEMNEVDNSIAILKKGMENVPKTHWRYWYFPFYIAFNYMYYKNDYKTAAQYLQIASECQGSPTYLPLLTARLYANTDSSEIAIPFLIEMIESSKNNEQKIQLKTRLNELISLRNIKFLENAKNKYNSIFHKYPDKLDLLISEGIITSIPDDPMGKGYYISDKDYSIKSTVMPDQLEVHIDKKN